MIVCDRTLGLPVCFWFPFVGLGGLRSEGPTIPDPYDIRRGWSRGGCLIYGEERWREKLLKTHRSLIRLSITVVINTMIRDSFLKNIST